jgi:hypothetical protein
VLTWLPATLPAPQVYRIAIPALGRLAIRLFHLNNPTYVAAGFDFIFSFLALNIFYRLTTERPGIEEVPGNRALVVVLFLAFIQFPLTWVVPWQRPETLPSALFLAVALFSLVRSRESAKWSVLLLLAAAFQAFVRSDVALVFGIALTAVSLTGRRSSSFGSRRSNLINGLLVIVIAGGTQAYLQFVRFPHRHYPPGTDVIQFRNNLHFHNLSSASLAVAPFLLLGVIVAVRRISLDALEILIVVGFVLWSVVYRRPCAGSAHLCALPARALRRRGTEVSVVDSRVSSESTSSGHVDPVNTQTMHTNAS